MSDTSEPLMPERAAENVLALKNVFVVVGQRGEYSDETIWSVCVHATREQAELHVELLRKALEEFAVDRPDDWSTPLDPNFSPWSSYETTYGVEELPFVWHVDQFMGADR